MAVTKAKPAAEVKDGSHPFPWLNLVVTEPFYLFHLLLFFSYFVVRSSAIQNFSPDLSLQLLRREIQAFLVFSVLTAVKFVREETWEAFIADILFYSKVLLFAVSLVIDYHVAFCYSVAFLAIFVLAQQPPYDGVGETSHLTPLQLETLLAEGNSCTFWLVEFRVLCSSTCIRTSRVFPDLSIIYSNKNLSFGIVDLGHFPNAAVNFGIPLSGPHPPIFYMKMEWKLLGFRPSSTLTGKLSVSGQLLPRAFYASILSWTRDLLNTYRIEY